jgi:hypothetical protein
VHLFGPHFDDKALSASQAASSLLICVAMGVPIYALSITLLWFFSGRPEDSAESFVMRKVPEIWNGVRARAFGQAP